MPITYSSRTGKTYYLHTGPRRGGGVQHYFSAKTDGALAEQVPEGFEIYESVDGKVFLRRCQPKLITDDECDCIRRGLAQPKKGFRCKLEVHGKTLTVYESDNEGRIFDHYPFPLSTSRREELAERFASYQAVLRFILVDAEQRFFAPERFCFRGSVDDWISIGDPGPIEKLASKYLCHLGSDSMLELL